MIMNSFNIFTIFISGIFTRVLPIALIVVSVHGLAHRSNSIDSIRTFPKLQFGKDQVKVIGSLKAQEVYQVDYGENKLRETLRFYVNFQHLADADIYQDSWPLLGEIFKKQINSYLKENFDYPALFLGEIFVLFDRFSSPWKFSGYYSGELLGKNTILINLDNLALKQIEGWKITLAHEFTHLLQYHYNPRAETFIEEGLAKVLETDLFGDQHMLPAVYHLQLNPAKSLLHFDNSPASYAHSWLFFKYIKKHLGGMPTIVKILKSQHQGIRGIDQILQQQAGVSFEDAFVMFSLAMYVNSDQVSHLLSMPDTLGYQFYPAIFPLPEGKLLPYSSYAKTIMSISQARKIILDQAKFPPKIHSYFIGKTFKGNWFIRKTSKGVDDLANINRLKTTFPSGLIWVVANTSKKSIKLKN